MEFFRNIFTNKEKKIKYSIIIGSYFSVFFTTFIWFELITEKFPQFIDDKGNLQYSNLQFFFGPLLENLIDNHQYKQKIFEIEFYLSRMPLMPYLISFINLFITKSFFITLLIKNFILLTILLILLFDIFKKNYLVLISLILIFYNPYNSSIFIRLIPEESFLMIFFLCLFLYLSTKKEINFFYVGFLIVLIYFTKASMMFYCYSIVFLFLFYNKSLKKIIPMIMLVFAFCSWSYFSLIKNDKFVSPLNLSSISGFTVALAYNDQFLNTYPTLSPDLLLDDIIQENYQDIKNLKNEIQINDVFKKYFFIKLKNDKEFIINSLIVKIKFLLTNIKYDSQQPDSQNLNKIRYSEIFNKISLNLAIIVCIISIFKNKKKEDLYYIFFLVTYLFPYLLGFLYSRHLVPIYIISNFFLFIKIFNKKIKNI